jgi:hypothetical protein
MIENFLYLIMGFVVTYLSMELAWHFTACRIKEDKREKIKQCMFKEIRTILVAPMQTSAGGRVKKDVDGIQQ